MAFSATRAALEGFRLVGRRPISILVWAIFYTLVSAALIAAAVMFLGSTFVGEIIRNHHNPEWAHNYNVESPEELWELFGPMAVGAAVLIPAIIILSVVQLCAVFRAVLRPKDRGFAYLQFGGDELRQIGLMIIMTLFFGLLACGFVAALVFGLKTADLDDGLKAAIGIVGGIAFFVLMIVLSIRLSLAQPMTFAQRRIRFFGSWGITKGKFWPLLGMYILAGIFAIIVYFAGDALATFAAGQLGFSMESLFSGDTFAFDIDNLSFEQLSTVFGTGGLVYVLISMLSSAIQLAIGYAPQAAAYRDVTEERNPSDPAPVAADPHGDDHGHGAAAAGAAALAAGAAAVAADAHAHADHGHGHGHGDPGHGDHGHAAPAATPLADAHGDHGHAAPAADAHVDHGHGDHGHGDAHGAPAADAHGDHGHGDHGHGDHGHGDHGHGDAHAAPVADSHGHGDHGHGDHGHGDHGHGDAHAAPAADAHGDHGHGDHGHGDHGHGDAHAAPAADAHGDHGHGDHGHAAPAADAHADHGHGDHGHGEAHPAAPDPHGDSHGHGDGHGDGHGHADPHHPDPHHH